MSRWISSQAFALAWKAYWKALIGEISLGTWRYCASFTTWLSWDTFKMAIFFCTLFCDGNVSFLRPPANIKSCIRQSYGPVPLVTAGCIPLHVTTTSIINTAFLPGIQSPAQVARKTHWCTQALFRRVAHSRELFRWHQTFSLTANNGKVMIFWNKKYGRMLVLLVLLVVMCTVGTILPLWARHVISSFSVSLADKLPDCKSFWGTFWLSKVACEPTEKFQSLVWCFTREFYVTRNTLSTASKRRWKEEKQWPWDANSPCFMCLMADKISERGKQALQITFLGYAWLYRFT